MVERKFAVHYVIEFTCCHGSETVLAGCAAILIEQLLWAMWCMFESVLY